MINVFIYRIWNNIYWYTFISILFCYIDILNKKRRNKWSGKDFIDYAKYKVLKK